MLFIFLSNFAWAKIEPLQLEQPNCALPLREVPTFMVSLGDLKITYDQHIFWREDEVILFQNHSRIAIRPHKHSTHLFRILLALVDAADTVVSDKNIYEDVWFNHNWAADDIRMNVAVAMMGIQKSFQEVDRTFGQIKRFRGAGFMWDTGELKPDFVDGDFAAVTSKKIVFWKGNKIQMTRAQFDLALHLYKNRGRILSFDSLYLAHSNSSLFSDDDNLPDYDKLKMTVHVAKSKIIKLFKDVDPTFDFIENVYGQGVTWRKD